jgi:hypothetical protein
MPKGTEIPNVRFASLEEAKANVPCDEAGVPHKLKLYKVCTPATGETFLYDRSPMSALGRIVGGQEGYSAALAERAERKAADPVNRVKKSLDKLSADEKQKIIDDLLGSMNAAPAESNGSDAPKGKKGKKS